MKTDILQQEILLLAGTTFSKRQLHENDARDSNHLTESEKLEEACWTGLPDELLPEIITNKELSIWQIGDSESSLQIELSEYPSEQKQFSINPYYFLWTIGYN